MGSQISFKSRLPDQGVHWQSTIRVVTLKPDRPPRENIKLDELTIPVSALIRGEASLKSKSAAYERQLRPEGEEEDEADDWKTILRGVAGRPTWRLCNRC